MSSRAETLAQRFKDRNRELIDVVKAIPESGWNTYCSEEQWTVGVVAHHVASDYIILADVTGAIVQGDAPALTWEMLHQVNAEHLEEHGDCAKEETLTLLHSSGEKVVETIRSLSDQDLECRAILPFLGEQPVSTEQFIEQAVIGHIGEHQPSIEQAIADHSVTHAAG